MSEKLENENELSTSALAKALGMDSQILFKQLAEMGLIVRNANNWELTSAGKLKGGIYRQGDKYRYIVWPKAFKSELDGSRSDASTLLFTATAIGKHFEISATRTNSILSELGWIKRGLKGWIVTELGKRLGGVQSEDKNSGVPYVRWPESIISNRTLVNSMREAKGDIPDTSQEQTPHASKDDLEFREKFPAKLRAMDGHLVRSKAELLIDNWLYVSEVTHAYERKLQVEEEVYSDFYIPTGKVYIEYWGLEDDPKYSFRKEEKRKIYKKYSLQVIELTEREVQNLDDTLPRLLLKHGIKTE
ncbi:MAG: glycerol kinase [Chloroflexota bacterium]